jgi:PAS domain S-box-containing protein
MGAMLHRRPEDVLRAVAAPGEKVVLLGLDEVEDGSWAVLGAAAIELVRVTDVPAALQVLAEPATHVVIADALRGAELIRAARAERDLAHLHVVVGAHLGSDRDLRKALDAGADDVLRIPFEPEVLSARVAAGLRAARLRASEERLASLVENIPGAVYRCACDGRMQWISAEIERIAGYPPSDFIDSAVRTFASVIHPDDIEGVERAVCAAVDAGRPYGLEYRLVRPDGSERWVLERGQALDAGGRPCWRDGAIFDITARRAAEQALREHEVMQAQLAEVQASRARIIEAADHARREIERDLHDGAQQRLVSAALELQLWIAGRRELPEDALGDLREVLSELRAGLAELRDLARGLHPVLLTERGLRDALTALGLRCPVPVELHVELKSARLPQPIEATAYFVVSEALTNVARHAAATHAWVTVARRDGWLELEVRDDGVGGAASDPPSGSGLQGLRDRVAAVQGALQVDSTAGKGTVVRARLPI